MKRYICLIVLIIALTLSLFACGENDSDSNSSFVTNSSEQSVNESSDGNESSNVDESSKDNYPSFSKETVDESLDISAFSFTTDKTEYSFNDIAKLTLTAESEYSFYIGEDHYVEFFDGEWKKCESGYDVPGIIHEAKEEAKIKFKISERADRGKEKYRVVLDVRMSYDTETVFTVYSNEFFIKAE